MDDRRAENRSYRTMGAKARFRDISRDCILLDLSRSGARLKLLGFTGLPEKFELFVPDKGATYRAHIQWQFGDEIGVSFELGAGLGESELAEKVQRLEADVADLKRLLADVLDRDRRTRPTAA
jgi:hypothetical protein